jgi:hypothetical protein
MRPTIRRLLGYLLIFAGTLLPAARTASADELKTKGTTLTGTVSAVTASGITIKPDLGKGELIVALEDVGEVTTETRYYFVYGPSGYTTGQLLGIRDGKLLVGDHEVSATAIDPAELHVCVPLEGDETSFRNWLRLRSALWDGAFDLGFGMTQGTTDTTTLATGFLADRKKKPSRVTFQAGYRYGTQKEKGPLPEPRETTENEIKALLRGERDVLPRTFAFASIDGEYDEIEALSIRTVPKLGMGYRIWETKTGLFQVEAGGAYVYERFFGGDKNDFFSVAFGKLFETELPVLGAKFSWRTDYLPSVEDWTGDFLVRSSAALLVPMVGNLNLKLAATDEYDNTPAAGTDENTMTTTAGVALTY